MEKVTNPGIKKIFRIYDKKTGKMKADVIALQEETIDETEVLTLFDDSAKWKRMTLQPGTYTTRELLVPIFENGKCVYQSQKVMDIQAYCNKEKDTLWEEHKRNKNPHIVPVDLSEKLSALKSKLIEEMTVK